MLICRYPCVCPVCGHPSLFSLLVNLHLEEHEPQHYRCSSCGATVCYDTHQWFRTTSAKSTHGPHHEVWVRGAEVRPVRWRFTALFPSELELVLRGQCRAYLETTWRRIPTLDGPDYVLDWHANGLMGILMHEVYERPSVKKLTTAFLYQLIGHGLCLLQAWDANIQDREHPTPHECDGMADEILHFYIAQLCPEWVQVIQPGEDQNRLAEG